MQKVFWAVLGLSLLGGCPVGEKDEEGTAPTVNITSPLDRAAYVVGEITFVARVEDADGSPTDLELTWRFTSDDGSTFEYPATATSETLIFSWEAETEGTWTTTLTATDADGLTASDSVTLGVIAEGSDTGDTGEECPDVDGDKYANETCGGSDCNDGNSAVNPGATEICNGVDDNCDGNVDGDAVNTTQWYPDTDADGYGDDDVSGSLWSCTQPKGYVNITGDCNDADARYNPGATEVCTDTVDYNCDGFTGAVDNDGDGYAACEECNDGSAAINPGATEVCDSLDNDCDGSVDEEATDASTWYADADTDGYGGTVTQVACAQPFGYVADSSDCNDGNSAINPGATEVCDSLDNDCDGSVDVGATDASTWYADADGDEYGDSANTQDACTAPAGYVEKSADCNDGNSAINPGATEICNDVDDNCDGTIDVDSSETPFWYVDADGDGYGDPATATSDCDQPEGSVDNDGDCDDGNAKVSPDSPESCDSVDNDCDGSVDDGVCTVVVEEDFGDGGTCTGSPFGFSDTSPMVYSVGGECGVYVYGGGSASGPSVALTHSMDAYLFTAGTSYTASVAAINTAASGPVTVYTSLDGSTISVAVLANPGDVATVDATWTADGGGATLQVWTNASDNYSAVVTGFTVTAG